jgi:hypothetical protein
LSVARCVQCSDVYGADLECGLVLGCLGDVSAIAATNDWQLVRFQLKVISSVFLDLR